MEASSDHSEEDEAPQRRSPSAPLAVPDTGVIFHRRRFGHQLTTGRLSTDSGHSDADLGSLDGGSPRRVSVGAESGYGSPFAVPAAGHYFTFSPPLTGAHPGQHRRRESGEASSSFRSIGTQTMTAEMGLSDEEDDDDNISLEGSYADDAFYEDGEQEALGMFAMAGPLPDLIPEAHSLNLDGNGTGARPRNRAHSVSLPIGLNDPTNPEDLGRCLKWIATEFDDVYRCSRRVNCRQNDGRNDVTAHPLPMSASCPQGENGFFAFLRSSLGPRRRQRSQSASEAPTWAVSRDPPRARDAAEAPSTSSASATQTPRHNSRHPDKFL